MFSSSSECKSQDDLGTPRKIYLIVFINGINGQYKIEVKAETRQGRGETDSLPMLLPLFRV